ncbi:DUF2927 domain-containing protein [Reyranella sp. CPCC 100927]|uniref:DUF2927 domain-containing protein n=1 Tax=Reyranella sp. CPCC 100927 TaxID=2599616 RepID=UPI0011B5C50E|nr:DUF2927 domain-containing protein [Reyranella sp. CPCC 100927]TWT04998.1 DUF2927 domain-containing protein [Reyranella sp. CPCC 100927]
MMRLATWVAFAIAIACGPLKPADASDGPGHLSLDGVARAFDDAALRVNNAPATELARWTDPIYLALADDAGMAPIAPAAEAAVRALAAIAGVPVTRVAWRDRRVNFRIQPGQGDRAGKSPCRSTVDWTESGRMVRAEIYVNLANAERITRCINHETMHGFGFRSHAHAALSVLSYTHAGQAELTAVDTILIETLYDRRLKPGMPAETAAPLACSIIAEKIGATAAAATLCPGRGATAKRGLAAFGGPRSLADSPPTLPALQPGYRGDGL